MTELEKLKRLLLATNKDLSKEDLVKSYQQALFLILKITQETQANLDSITKMEGPQGEKGDKGDKGDVGEQGIQGIEGKPGKDGKDGKPGKDGASGERGLRGPMGLTGKPGISGTSGKDGKSPEVDYEKLLDLVIPELNKQVPPSPKTFVFGGARNSVEYTDLSSQLNGSKKTFTVPRRRFVAVLYSSAPFILRPDIDYTGSGTYTLTLTSEIVAPPAGQTLILFHSRV